MSEGNKGAGSMATTRSSLDVANDFFNSLLNAA